MLFVSESVSNYSTVILRQMNDWIPFPMTIMTDQQSQERERERDRERDDGGAACPMKV